MWIIQVTTLWVEALLLEVQKKIVFNVSDIKATTLKVVPKSNFFFAQPGEGYYHRKSSLRKTLGWHACLWMDYLFTLTM